MQNKTNHPRLMMGNEAIALAAINAGVSFVSGYPGTPSTEAIETIIKMKPANVHYEWSVNEKVALEVAAGASYAGARTFVTMKQVGLNVASDPLMSLNYVGVVGGMVILVADDPGPISSQTEQDTRRFAAFARLMVLDPSTPEEAYDMTLAAFELSERFKSPVVIRPTTRVCHACAPIAVGEYGGIKQLRGFVKSSDFVIFPRLSYKAKLGMVEREPAEIEAQARFNFIINNNVNNNANNNNEAHDGRRTARVGAAFGGVSYAYAADAIASLSMPLRKLKIGAPNPFPEALAAEFLEGLDEVIVFEELDSVIEDALRPLCAERNIVLRGKRSRDVPVAGELSERIIRDILVRLYGDNILGHQADKPQADIVATDAPQPPVRPPVLCAGCPHRASFYAVKRASRGKKAVYCGDIGCYTLGNAPPLNMVDTCLCMGAGITVAQGIANTEPDTLAFAFIGDSTFFHTGMPGVLNAVYNRSNIIIVVLDNRTTGMTGAQPHPGTGYAADGSAAIEADIESILRTLGVPRVYRANPFELDDAIHAAKQAMEGDGVRAIIYTAPCIVVAKRGEPYVVRGERCTGCQACVKSIGCPAIFIDTLGGGQAARIDDSLCTGCSLCAAVCPAKCIEKSVEEKGVKHE